MTREQWKRFEEMMDNPEVQLAMQARCEEQGHEWENACTMMMRVYQVCKWCGEKR